MNMEKPRKTTAINTNVIRTKIKSFRRMPTLVTDILKIMNNPHVDSSQIVQRMKYDPGLTANVLRLANSAYFGMPRSVSSINEAVVRLGIKRLCDLVIATGMGSELKKGVPGYNLLPMQLLQHSAWVAAASEELCNVLNLATPDLLFTAGLLHDIGKLIICDFVENDFLTIQDSVETMNLSFEEAEKRIIGINHAEAGAELLAHWNFPDELITAVRCHHTPEKAGTHGNIAGIVHIADTLAYSQGIGTGIDGFQYKISKQTTDKLNITAEQIQFVASVTLDKMLELQEILLY